MLMKAAGYRRPSDFEFRAVFKSVVTQSIFQPDAALQKELSYKSSRLRKRMIIDEERMEAKMAMEGRLPGYLQEKRREGRSGQQ